MNFDYDQDTLDQVNDFLKFLLSDIVVHSQGRWTVCYIVTDIEQHCKMLEWCSQTLGRKHRGVKTGVFKLFAIPGRWYYDQGFGSLLNTSGVRRRYWFRNSSDFEMFKLVWFDELAS
mgnify:CR=1 FL=1